jgi:hypothetical protein
MVTYRGEGKSDNPFSFEFMENKSKLKNKQT